jgi:hypothetical protein
MKTKTLLSPTLMVLAFFSFLSSVMDGGVTIL